MINIGTGNILMWSSCESSKHDSISKIKYGVLSIFEWPQFANVPSDKQTDGETEMHM
jgi:hypothetical protein